MKPDVSSRSLFEDDKYLQPVLEDDALLFCLDDLLDGEAQDDQLDGENLSPTDKRIAELEQSLATLHLQYSEYKSAVEQTLDERWEDPKAGPSKTTSLSNGDAQQSTAEEIDKGYFDSYSYNGM